ncbi:MAG: DNA polymerase III subunit delta [Erysipelotrichaceae bacterium]|nr:DNA polymerase III subunit delta [Erysipelotrichaceae bacterium]
MIKEQLASEQPIAYRTLSHALMHNKIAHAYLFHGPSGTPKLECAYLLAQSLLCEHVDRDGFACEKCIACNRIKDHNFADMVILDGKNTSIKKENILKLQYKFHKTGLEHTGKKIYILNFAENATADALNSLLKFLEEPASEMIAILVVEQMDRLLPTIISRCQPIPFHPLTFDYCFKKMKKEMDILDAYLLSKMIRSLNEIRDVSESDEYQHARYVLEKFLSAFILSPYRGLDVLLQNGFDQKKQRDAKQSMRYFLDMLMVFYRDVMIENQMGSGGWYEKQLIEYRKKQTAVIKLLEIAMHTRDKLWKSVNISLLCDQMVDQMKEAVQ